MNDKLETGMELFNINIGSNPKDNADIALSTAVDLAMAAKSTYNDAKTYSLPAFTKSTQIASTVYIQDILKNDEILPDTLQCAQQLYTAWILAAINLNNYIDGTSTKVKDALALIASEAFKNMNLVHIPTEDIINGLENFSGMEATITAKSSQDLTKDVKLPVGRTVELEIKGVNGQKNTINVQVNVFPQFIPESISHTVIKLGKQELLRERWFKVRTGEYRFFRDFLFELNRRKDIKRAIKDDSTGLLLSIIQKQESSFGRWIQKVWASAYNQIAKKNTNISQNIANSIYVFNKADFDYWCKESNIRINLPSSRDELMMRLMAMMIVVIDPDFRSVEMYFNGIANSGEYTYNQISTQSKSEKYDLAYIMQSFSKTNAPRF